VAAAGDADRLGLEQAGFYPAPEFPWSEPAGFAEFVCRHGEFILRGVCVRKPLALFHKVTRQEAPGSIAGHRGMV
jgi:hypothetical protein